MLLTSPLAPALRGEGSGVRGFVFELFFIIEFSPESSFPTNAIALTSPLAPALRGEGPGVRGFLVFEPFVVIEFSPKSSSPTELLPDIYFLTIGISRLTR